MDDESEYPKDYSVGPVSAIAPFNLQKWLSGEQWTKYPHTLPPEYYQAIGEICHRWAWLEFQCGVIAREVARLDKNTGYAFMGGMGMRPAANVLLALSHGEYLNKHPELKKLTCPLLGVPV